MKKYPLILIAIFIASTILAQTNFTKGFNDGYKKGYCQDQGIGCIEPIPPIAPIPKIEENSNSYTDGYNRGFKMGLNAHKSNDLTSSNTTNRTRYKTANSEYIDYVYKSNISLKLLLAEKEAENHRLQNEMEEKIKNMQEHLVSLIKDGKYDEVIAIKDRMLEFMPENFLRYIAPFTYYYTSLAFLGKYNKTGEKSDLSKAYDYALKSKSYGVKINSLLEKIQEEKNNSNNTYKNYNNDYDKTVTTTLKMDGKLRISDSPLSNVIKSIPKGATVRVIENKGDYWKIFYDGKTGYLNEMYLNITYNMSLMRN